MSAFEELGVCPEIIHAIEEDDWLLPTPVQAEAIPLILGGGDVCVAAETGSGKTGAFGLPCLQIVHEALRHKAEASVTKSMSASGSSTVAVRLDMDDKDPYVLITEDGTECKSEEARNWTGIRANADVLKGKYMFEVEICGEGQQGSICRVGVGTSISKLALGTDDKSFGYGGTGKKSWNNSFEDYGRPYKHGDTVGCLIDRVGQTVSFALNGEMLGIAYSLPPAIHNQPLRPGICGKLFHARFKFCDVAYPVDGYKPIGSLLLSDTPRGMSIAIEQAGKVSHRLLALILEPTRDLAQQTYKCLNTFGQYLTAPTIRTGLFVGGIDEKGQKQSLQQGVDIAVGTVSKVMDYIRRRELDVGGLKFLILDEADDLMKNDDKKDIPKLKKMAASSSSSTSGRVQTLFFSATLHSMEVRTAVEAITHMPTWVDLKGQPTIPDTVHFVLFDVNPKLGLQVPLANAHVTTDGVHGGSNNNTPDLRMSEGIKQLKPHVLVKIADALKMESCLVFCRTNVDCNNLEAFLNQLGGGRGFAGKTETGKESPYSCVVLAGMRSQDERQANLEHFKQGDVRFLICTDVAARGIDIKELPYLVMMTLPDDPDQFFHRVGRVGRADRMGLAISIACLTHKEKVWYHKCAKRGLGCTNTSLVAQGGCTIWYDEPLYQKQIEERIGKAVPRMDPQTLAVEGILDPSDGRQGGQPLLAAQQSSSCTASASSSSAATTAAILGRRRLETKRKTCSDSMEEKVVSGKAGNMIIYGKTKDDENSKATSKHTAELCSAVSELLKLEKQVQQQYVVLATMGIQ
eukprot:GHVQ01036009.1.p1 GENE.GHVQ01036009.1~~GHVQ01036009.1.p1  ORF type:complete len:801 (+),score=146.66 GHVQ01036009.1:663-3065(+)